jgi:hypothetical protein
MTAKMARSGWEVTLADSSTASPPATKAVKANSGCWGWMLPGKIPTPSTPRPSRPVGMVTARRSRAWWANQAATRIMAPAASMVALKMVAEGWRMTPVSLAPRSLISILAL